MSRYITTLSTLLVLPLAGSIALARQVPTLDLSQRPAGVERRDGNPVNGIVVGEPVLTEGGTTTDAQRVLPLRVTLKLDSQDYRYNEQFFYELEIQNTSTVALLVPGH